MSGYFGFAVLAFLAGYILNLGDRGKIYSYIFSAVVLVDLTMVNFFIVSDYFTGEGVNDAVIYHLLYGLKGAGFREYIPIILISFTLLVGSLILSYGQLGIRENVIFCGWVKKRRVTACLLVVASFALNPVTSFLFSKYTNTPNNEGVTNNIDQVTNRGSFPLPMRGELPNIVFIFAEGLERTYFDNSMFPGLMRELSELESRSLSFTDIRQIAGSGWTIAGMVSTLCGVPLAVRSGGNSMSGTEEFYSGAICLGDILKKYGYDLSFYQGSSIEFSGIDNFYKTHSFDTVKGKEEILLEMELKPMTHNWGLYDETLFEVVYKDYLRINRGKTRSALFLATINTHHPEGHHPTSCNGIKHENGENKMLNAVACSDQQISNFIKKIQQSPYGKQTIIVLASDHLALKNDASKYLTRVERRNLFTIIDPRKKGSPKFVSKPGAQLDIGTTLLKYLGLDIRIGLGEDLLGEKLTLTESKKDINQYLRGIWGRLEKLWEFPAIEDVLVIDTQKGVVEVGKKTYQYPVLIRLDDELNTTPYFDFHNEKKLTSYLLALNLGAQFVWVDQCDKMSSFLIGPKKEDNFCVLYGKAGSDLIGRSIGNKTKLSKAQILEVFSYNTHKDKYEENRINVALGFFSEQERTMLKYATSKSLIYMPRVLDGEVKSILEQYYGVAFIFEPHLKKPFFGLTSQMSAELFESLYDMEIVEDYTSIRYKLKNMLRKPMRDFFGKNYKIKMNAIAIFSPKSFPNSRTKEEIVSNMNDVNRFIAHGGGKINGDTYTNSLEALNLSYEKGFRLFELDIIKTSDNVFVAAHDWEHWSKLTGYKGELPPTLEIFDELKIFGKYTPIDIAKINEWFEAHSDAILVTDKVNEPVAFSSAFMDKNRLIMELFSIEALQNGLKADIRSAMPSWNVILKFDKDNVADTLVKLGVRDVALSRREILRHFDLVREFAQRGINLYVFHVNFDRGKDELYVVCNEMNFIYGLYADQWDFSLPSSCERNQL